MCLCGQVGGRFYLVLPRFCTGLIGTLYCKVQIFRFQANLFFVKGDVCVMRRRLGNEALRAIQYHDAIAPLSSYLHSALLRVMIQPGIYLHYKGKQYEVIGRALHSETLEALVVYKPLYPTPDVPEGTLWVRPEAMFSEMVLVNGEEVPRFRLLGG